MSLIKVDTSPYIIEPKSNLLSLDLREIWRYRDLLILFVRRDFVAQYKQTILGPLWYLLQPLFTTLIFTFIFGRIAGLSTDGVPHMLFYLAGLTPWNYFADCINNTADTFRKNEHIFGKVYFPRVIVPLSVVIANLVKFGIQLLILLALYLYFVLDGAAVTPNATLLLFPLLVFILGGLGLGFGMIISSMTTKYRDLLFLITFGVQLLLYATPVIYPLSTIPERYKPWIMANPMTGVVETFKFGALSAGEFSWGLLGYSFGFTCLLLLLALITFNRTEKTFMDTI